MTTDTLAKSYLSKARTRLKVLDLLLSEQAHSDVAREAQELVELATKGMLRHIGVEPPKWHDVVGPILLEHASRFPAEVQAALPRLAEISKALRKEREFSFYGDVDFIPTQEYGQSSAETAIASAHFIFLLAEQVISEPSPT